MNTLLIVFGAMLFIVAAMAIGVIVGRKPIAGSCGGMSAIGMDTACDVCGGDKNRCEKESKNAAEVSSGAEFYNADK
ncbi:MAG: (Na+)-NQR maturation NqrM [Oleibacter sp.]|nr:(Na+)-NQR maturation NqrM [Thalassolituus sp.]